jgi:excisionase family DNA binding protein
MKGLSSSNGTQAVSSSESGCTCSLLAEDEPYTVGEIAGWLKVDPATIQREIHRGRLRALKVGRIYRVFPQDFANYVATQTA